MRKLLLHTLCIVATLCGVTTRSTAQDIVIGADFDMLFDNKEYSPMTFDESGTLFSARLTPKLGVKWAERNELMFAADLVQDFGHASKFLSDVNVQLYYAYRATKVTVLAGIFPRENMRGLRTPLFFDRTYRYYHNRISGVLARYEDPKWGDSFVEFAFDYTGMRDFDTREAFMIMSSGRMPIKWFYMGYDLLMGHYAKDYNPDTDDGVVDNLFVAPYIGYDFTAGEFDIDIRLTYIQSLQRDRHAENVWRAPMGGELYAAISRWGVTLSNRFYGGKSLLTHYDRYGADLYAGSPFYATTKGFYDAITASYEQRFLNNTVGVSAGITAEWDGTGWGTRQWIAVNVNLDYNISLKRKAE